VASRPADGPWAELTCCVPSTLSDEIIGCFTTESLGAWASPGDGGDERLRIFFESMEQAQSAEFRVKALIERLGLEPRACALTVRPVADGHWLERYQAALQPFPLAERFLVCPSGEPAPGEGRIPIRLVPGRAFGTGEHPTTRLSAELLERRVRPGEGWLDLGCGTAILSLVAMHCGASRLLAVDIDPEAVRVAREVLEANRALDRVETRAGTGAALPGGWDGVVVNILASFFHAHAEELARLVNPGGTVVASGFLGDELAGVEASLAGHGLESIERVEQGEWRACAFRKNSDDGTR